VRRAFVPEEEDGSQLAPWPGRRHGAGHAAGQRGGRGKRRRLTAAIAVIAAAAIAAGVVVYNRSVVPSGPLPVNLPISTASYLGVYAEGAPASYAGVTAFASTTGARPDLAMGYSGWYVPFPARFAASAADNGAAPLIQMDPDGISLAAIASGRFDGYLSAYAEAVRAYRHPVVIGFGHEMNGDWYSWGYRNTKPATFVAAWRHIVTLFRALGARNVTWLWTVNIINDTQAGKIPDPAPWWPGDRYVTWVGIDGYYLKPNWQFAPLFGPTITAVRKLTGKPVLIGETGATPGAGQPAKIADLFAGIRTYGLLGFVWFDTTDNKGQQFGISTPAATGAFGKGAGTYRRPGS
jgi:mannan endo-1,4-beta-mannosidase